MLTSLGLLPTGGPLYLGIINVTPDSFSDGGRFLAPEAALAQAQSLLDQGVQVLDLGAESTRPQAAPVTPDEEWARLEPVLTRLRAALPQVPLSLDTRHPEVAARGLACGVAVLNDVTGFRAPGMLQLAQGSGCGLIAMRSRMAGEQFLMPPYDTPGPATAEAALAELAAVKDRILGAGIDPARVLLDPGFGFGMSFSEDRALWEALPRLPGALDWPVDRFCLGVSRKRLLAAMAGTPALPEAERDALTARAHRQARDLGYRVFRGHAGPRASVRAARAEDAPVLAQVQISSWREAYRDILPATTLEQLAPDPLAESFRAMASAPPHAPTRLWVVTLGAAICGYAATGPAAADDLNSALTAEIYGIYLLKEVWGLGLGRTLMAHALAAFRTQGYRRACLWVLERNARAQRFYEAGGWAPSRAVRTVWHGGIPLRERSYRKELGV